MEAGIWTEEHCERNLWPDCFDCEVWAKLKWLGCRVRSIIVSLGLVIYLLFYDVWHNLQVRGVFGVHGVQHSDVWIGHLPHYRHHHRRRVVYSFSHMINAKSLQDGCFTATSKVASDRNIQPSWQLNEIPTWSQKWYATSNAVIVEKCYFTDLIIIGY